MSIHSLDYFTIINIASRLDLQSFYSFSRTSKTFKEVCQKVDCNKVWEKETYDIFVDVMIDSIVDCEAKMSNNIFLFEASLNMIQYVNSIINNITREFHMFKHPKEVIQLISPLAEVLLNIDYKDTLILCAGPVRRYSKGFEKFSCSENTFYQSEHLFVEENDSQSNNNERKSIKSYTYLKIPKRVKSIEVLLKDKEFQNFCSIVRKMTKFTDISDKTIAFAMQILFKFYPTLEYSKSTLLKFMDQKKLSLLINQLLDIRNMNIKYILSRNILLKQVMNNVMIISNVTSHHSFNEFIEHYMYFVKYFHGFCLTDVGERADLSKTLIHDLFSKKEYIKFLFKSLSCIGKKIDYKNQKYEFKFLLHGPHNQIELFYWWGKEFNIRYFIDGVNVDPETILEEDIKVKKVAEIINNCLMKNLHNKEVEGQENITPLIVLLLLRLVLFVRGSVNYKGYYHAAIINLESIRTRRRSQRIAAKNAEQQH